MAPGSAPAPPEARGREPPFLLFFFFFLDLLPRWEKGFPSGPWPPWHGRGESPSEIGSVSLFLSVSAFPAFSDSIPSPFPLYLEIRISDWGESFAQIFLVKLAFLRQKRASTALRGGHEGQGRAPCLVAPSGTVSRGFFFPKIIYIPKKSPLIFSAFRELLFLHKTTARLFCRKQCQSGLVLTKSYQNHVKKL